jgi:hypothetical protein
VAQGLASAGEQVVDVPAQLAARARLLNSGHARKTDALDAASVAAVAVHHPRLRLVRGLDIERAPWRVAHRAFAGRSQALPSPPVLIRASLSPLFSVLAITSRRVGGVNMQRPQRSEDERC